MIKRLFGMHHLNVTQWRYGLFSHKYFNAYDLAGSDSGIDYFRAPCDLIVIGVHKFYKGKGFANTIHFYDEQNDVTLSMTHMNIVDGRWYVGKIFHTGEVCYMEGTTGMATGNHIHLELGKGRQPVKTVFKKIGATKYWGLKNWLNFEDYFYIDKTITVVRCPVKVDVIDKNENEEEAEELNDMSLSNGYKFHTINGVTMGTYILAPDEDLCLYTAQQGGVESWKALESIGSISSRTGAKAVINAGMFEGSTGQHLGVEISTTECFVPRNDSYNVFYEYMDNGINSFNYCSSNDFWLGKNDVKYAVTPYMIFNSERGVLVSRGYDSSYNRTPNTRAFTAWLKDGRRMIGVTTSAVTPVELSNALRPYIYTLCVYDGGGSTQMYVNGVRASGTPNNSRRVSNAIGVVKRDKAYDSWKPSVVDKVEEPPKESELEALRKENVALRARLSQIEKLSKWG